MKLRNALALSAAATVLAAAGCASGEGGRATTQAMNCADLKNLALDGVRIDVAEAITPNPTWAYPSGGPGFPGAPTGVSVPFCRVAGVADPEIGFEVWLPDDWNGKIQNVGNGGYSGAFSYSAAGPAVERGYAAGTTNTGHTDTGPFDASWAPGHPERVESFSHGAHHALAVVSKELVRARYGREQDYAYYTGCSTGGRQGLAEAQLYPEDYDGIVAGAPANNIVRLESTALWLGETVGEPLAPPLLALVANAAVAQCDAQDGIADGYITDPDGCGFDPASLTCEASDAQGQCLTPAQVETARRMHGRRESAGGLSLYPGRAYGTTFAGEVGPPTAVDQSLLALADSDYAWSIESFDYDRDVPPLEAEFPGLVAMNPELQAFAEGGGKLILWHGWVDPLISPINTLDYFAALNAEMGEEATADFARLYMLPGVSHCAGGPGPDTFDALSALEAWVERGEAPTRIIATKLGPDRQPTRTRPLCPYPQTAVYDEGGSTDDAASYSCQEL